jgi:two-component system, response regulator
MPQQLQRPLNLSQQDSEVPRYATPGTAAPVQRNIAFPKGGVLLIDDSEDDAELSLRGLHKLDLHVPVLWLNDSLAAVEALERVERSEDLPRLILLDLHMPRVDGYEVLRRLRAHKPTANLPIIVMVGSAKAPELPRCFNLGANAFVVKPIQAQTFLAACERAVVQWPVS